MVKKPVGLRIEMLRRYNDHRLTFDLTQNRPMDEVYNEIIAEVRRLVCEGGTNIAGKITTIDVEAIVEGFEDRDFMENFPCFFILIIRVSYDGEILEVELAIAKKDIYLFAYKYDGIWYNVDRADYAIVGGVPATFSVNYNSDDGDKIYYVGQRIIRDAMLCITRYGRQSLGFHTLCVNIAESARFENIRQRIASKMVGNVSGKLSAHEISSINCWSKWSKIWRLKFLVHKLKKEWHLSSKLGKSIPRFEKQTEEGKKGELEDWIEENLAVVKVEDFKKRAVRRDGYMPLLIQRKAAKRSREITTLQELENMRQNFWIDKIQQSATLEKGIWISLKCIFEHLGEHGLNRDVKAQLIVDHTDIKFKDKYLGKCEDDIGSVYELAYYILTKPSNVRN